MAGSSATRWGLAVFALGIAMLLGVFFLSYGLFSYTARLLEQAGNTPPASLPPLSRVLAANGIRVVFLLVMGYVASLIAGKGLSLYGATREENRAGDKDSSGA